MLNKTWIGSKCVFITNANGFVDIVRHETRLVEKGYGQQKAIDYNEIYTSVVKYTSFTFYLRSLQNTVLIFIKWMQ